MKTRTASNNMEKELGVLIDDLSGNLNSYNSGGSHNSRLLQHWQSKEYYENLTRSRGSDERNTSRQRKYYGGPNIDAKNCYREYNASRSSNRSYEGDGRHRDYLYNKYAKSEGSRSPSVGKRSTHEETWYRETSRNEHRPQSASQRTLNVPRTENRTPSPIGRPLSILSRLSYESGEFSPQSSRSVSPASHHKYSNSRSVSPKSNKSGAIGPFTQMVRSAHRREETGKQEYFRGRDSQTGKPLSGRHGFMNFSWPYGLNHIGDAYENPNLRLPADSPRESKVPYVPPPPIFKKAKSVEPPKEKKIPIISKSEGNTPIPDYLIGLRHIIVEDTPVPTPPRFGTLDYGGRYPNAAMAPYIYGPPCELCHKAITESRCIYAEKGQYHVWHFYCSFCSVVLKEDDFIIAADNKPYCNNCHKRMYP